MVNRVEVIALFIIVPDARVDNDILSVRDIGNADLLRGVAHEVIVIQRRTLREIEPELCVIVVYRGLKAVCAFIGDGVTAG